MADKIPKGLISYILGIVSIVFACFQPLAAIILGVVGIIFSKKDKSDLGKKAKKLNIIGIILGVVIFILMIAITIYLANFCMQNPTHIICAK
jgi:hypothetical protein